jgi:hypothetical protein
MYLLRIQHRKTMSRVTRLGDFWPIGPLFTLGSFLENDRSRSSFVLLISSEKLCINLDKKCVGLHFGLFFQNTDNEADS